jgi:AcrR family transcriptional regulator
VPEPSRRDRRREQILESTWKLIARSGLGATNMRALAREAGYANGALAHYFSGKEELLRAAFEYVSQATMRRIADSTRGLSGLAALRAFCAEILPDDELKALEARVVLPFWSSALTEPAFAALHATTMNAWRRQMRRYLRQAVAAGEIPRPRWPDQHAEQVEALLSMLMGSQVLGVLTPVQHGARLMRKLVSEFLAALAEA